MEGASEIIRFAFCEKAENCKIVKKPIHINFIPVNLTLSLSTREKCEIAVVKPGDLFSFTIELTETPGLSFPPEGEIC